MYLGAMGIVRYGCISSGAERTTVRPQAAQICRFSRQDMADQRSILPPPACCNAGSGEMAALTGPVFAQESAGFLHRIMRRSPMAVRGIWVFGPV